MAEEGAAAGGFTLDFEGFIDKLRRRIESGLLFTASAYANSWLSERLARKRLKEYAELAVGLGGAAVADLTGITRYLSGFDVYAEYILDGMSDYGFAKTVLEYKIQKKPLCYFLDENTVECKNFDADTVSTATVTVLVDDTQATASSVEGSPSAFKVSLASPVAKGWHKLVVIAGDQKKDAFRGRVYV